MRTQTPTLSDVDAKLERHIEGLGFRGVGSYRVWCHKQGLDKGLDKTDEALRREVELFRLLEKTRRPDPKPDYRPQHVRIITAAYEGKSHLSEYHKRIADRFDAIADDGERAALYRLIVHCEKYAYIRSPLEPIAYYYRDWLRPLEDWFPQSPNKKRHLSELLRHLFVCYEVPLFMDAAWSEEDGSEARRQQQWFKHIGTGGSVCALDADIVLSQRMAHLFLQASSHYTIAMAMRRAQFLGMGGSSNLVEAVVRSRLREVLADEPFWATVVLFLAGLPMLESAYIGPIVDYVYNQKFVARRIPGPGGEVIEGRPPQANMVMKGRSIDKLLRQVDAWHEGLGGLALSDHQDWQEWPSCGIRNYECEEEDETLGTVLHWSLVELRDSWALVHEGQAMHHCVRTYVPRCAKGEISVWSLQAAVGEGERQPILTISLETKRKVIIDFRGKYNMLPNGKKSTAKHQQMEGAYLYLLRQAPRIMGQWMQREQVQHK